MEIVCDQQYKVNVELDTATAGGFLFARLGAIRQTTTVWCALQIPIQKQARPRFRVWIYLDVMVLKHCAFLSTNFCFPVLEQSLQVQKLIGSSKCMFETVRRYAICSSRVEMFTRRGIEIEFKSEAKPISMKPVLCTFAMKGSGPSVRNWNR